ncbi:hypothetical protein CNEO2_440037 [Clostridium neonatale]|nr:hypothetical protein CNEO2_440037 [Clostridium neonatale]CAI3244519.1 hypothetical protein CNEO2_450036 [Clostridium neonatale]CAI3600424.1 hypothetical protein CNEO4_430036 [Clostridium neonatale]
MDIKSIARFDFIKNIRLLSQILRQANKFPCKKLIEPTKCYRLLWAYGEN